MKLFCHKDSKALRKTKGRKRECCNANRLMLYYARINHEITLFLTLRHTRRIDYAFNGQKKHSHIVKSYSFGVQ
ncbi:MAG: hypothetical protein SCABRO_03928 [Candidatus Scalindua brodae]|uniref:Uncharacterized protein n=1 Tax=Candidatus Scalindua brodae TaxID=237368 RepID=A0A0B0EE26_9BACT|nr:MAG: hypothetical protein SCABRO_03928 [Candidatus Scalindua brodae]